tara:strand:- start:20 stop:229 length:210 start_codon:yes stop_codon:yes gene_type:complete
VQEDFALGLRDLFVKGNSLRFHRCGWYTLRPEVSKWIISSQQGGVVLVDMLLAGRWRDVSKRESDATII